MEIPRHWRLKAQRYRLEGSVCLTCGQHSFPPRPVSSHYTTQPVRLADCELLVIPPLNRTLDIIPLNGR